MPPCGNVAAYPLLSPALGRFSSSLFRHEIPQLWLEEFFLLGANLISVICWLLHWLVDFCVAPAEPAAIFYLKQVIIFNLASHHRIICHCAVLSKIICNANLYKGFLLLILILAAEINWSTVHGNKGSEGFMQQSITLLLFFHLNVLFSLVIWFCASYFYIHNVP